MYEPDDNGDLLPDIMHDIATVNIFAAIERMLYSGPAQYTEWSRAIEAAVGLFPDDLNSDIAKNKTIAEYSVRDTARKDIKRRVLEFITTKLTK